MKYILALLIASLTVLTARRPKHKKPARDLSSSQEFFNDSGSLEDRYSGGFQNDQATGFNFKGTVKRSFALNAALANPSRNLICSPVSGLLPLGKLVLGTERGQSRDELLDALGYSKNKVKKRLRSLIKHLKYLPGVSLIISNTIYISKKHHLQSKYNRDTKSVFESTCQQLDFDRPSEAAAIINRKVRESTKGFIKEIISPGDITHDTSIIIVNAIYFMGTWKQPFKDTHVGNFHTPQGMAKVPMMSRHGSYNYYKSTVLDAQIIEMTYVGDKASFIIVLPAATDGLPLLLQQLKVAPELLDEAISKMKEYFVRLTIPKFKIETELNLNTLYEKIGVKRIFSKDGSGLTRIIRGNEYLYLSKAKQKAYIEVTEEGTEAGAATAAQIVALSGPARHTVFNADRPFLFFVGTAGEQLFAGIFTND